MACIQFEEVTLEPGALQMPQNDMVLTTRLSLHARTCTLLYCLNKRDPMPAAWQFVVKHQLSVEPL